MRQRSKTIMLGALDRELIRDALRAYRESAESCPVIRSRVPQIDRLHALLENADIDVHQEPTC